MEEETKVIEKTQEKSDIDKKELGLKWFKFLIYFGLWAGGIYNFVTGINMLTGNIYASQNVSPEKVYKVFPNLKGVDGFCGIVICLFSIFQIVTRFSLAKYKKSGPPMLYGMYVGMMIISLIYTIAVSSITGLNVGGTVISSIISSLVFLIINAVYLGNRKHLFVN